MSKQVNAAEKLRKFVEIADDYANPPVYDEETWGDANDRILGSLPELIAVVEAAQENYDFYGNTAELERALGALDKALGEDS